jgi:hypothetical protein
VSYRRIKSFVLWWGWPLLSVLLAPLVVVPQIGSQEPFRIVSPPDQRPMVVETASPFGSFTTQCYLDPESAPLRYPRDAARYWCPTTYPANTYAPGLLYFVGSLWMLSTRPRTRGTARLALYLGALQFAVPILLYQHHLAIHCVFTGACGLEGNRMIAISVVGVLGWLFSLCAIMAFVSRWEHLVPAVGRGAMAGSNLDRLIPPE